jgi:hypothetical protein
MQRKHPTLKTYAYDNETHNVYHRMGPLNVKLKMLTDDTGRLFFGCKVDDRYSHKYIEDFKRECKA